MENVLQNPTVFGQARKRRPSELVYFLQAEQLRLIKVGVANDLARRIGNLRTGSPDKLIILGIMRPMDRSATSLEQEIHSRFWADRHHGEWFDPSAGLLDYIAANVMGAGDDEDRQAWETACIALGAITNEIIVQPYPGDDLPAPAEAEKPSALARRVVARQRALMKSPA
jgi:hypothetical protein